MTLVVTFLDVRGPDDGVDAPSGLGGRCGTLKPLTLYHGVDVVMTPRHRGLGGRCGRSGLFPAAGMAAGAVRRRTAVPPALGADRSGHHVPHCRAADGKPPRDLGCGRRQPPSDQYHFRAAVLGLR